MIIKKVRSRPVAPFCEVPPFHGMSEFFDVLQNEMRGHFELLRAADQIDDEDKRHKLELIAAGKEAQSRLSNPDDMAAVTRELARMCQGRARGIGGVGSRYSQRVGVWVADLVATQSPLTDSRVRAVFRHLEDERYQKAGEYRRVLKREAAGFVKAWIETWRHPDPIDAA